MKSSLSLLLLLLLLPLLLLSCDGDTIYHSPECGNGVVEEGEQCDDGNRVGKDGCSVSCTVEFAETCDNNQDDDGDGLIDCADPECFDEEDCDGEICTNGIDDDSDGQIDCADNDCMNHPLCATPEECTNGIDDDLNGETDCEDSMCRRHPTCGACDPDFSLTQVGPGTESTIAPTSFSTPDTFPCNTVTEEFWVGQFQLAAASSLTIDATAPLSPFTLVVLSEEEPQVTCELDYHRCYNVTALPVEVPLLPPGVYRFYSTDPQTPLTFSFGIPVLERCNDGLDDDGNGLVDCEDEVCAQELHCLEEICDNNLDDDLDGLTDCADPDCLLFCAPDEVCDNSLDDDLDGHADCADLDCTGEASCEGSACITNNYLGSLTRGSFVTASFDTSLTPNNYSTSCGGVGPDYTLSFDLLSRANVLVHMTQSGFHSLALAQEAGVGSICAEGELACTPPTGIHLPITATYLSLEPARYFLLVDGQTADATGAGDLEIQVVGSNDELCSNGVDDDGDGTTDCDDLSCTRISFCAGEQECHNGMDDDLDGWTDCADNDCIGNAACMGDSCQVNRDLGTLSPGTPLTSIVTFDPERPEVTLACGAQAPSNAQVLSFQLAQPGRVRIRTIPIGFSQPVTSLAFPGGPGASCIDGEHFCSAVSAPGLPNTAVTPLELPAGGPYYLLVAPYISQEPGEAQIILYLEQP